MNLPNRLTLLRIALSFLLIFFVLMPGLWPKIAAAIVFTIAALTDLWDGQLARRKKLITDFGILMDPIADKILVLGAFVSFVQMGLVPAWMVVLIATREFLITGLRLFAFGKGHAFPAEAAGKNKTVSQVVAISLTLLFLIAREFISPRADGAHWIHLGQQGIWCLVLLTVVLTMTSGVSFLWKNRKMVLTL